MYSWCCFYDKYLFRNIKQYYNDVLVYSFGNFDSFSIGQDIIIVLFNIFRQVFVMKIVLVMYDFYF